MPVQQIKAGAKFTIYAWGDEEHCETLRFLKQLCEDGNSDAARRVYLMNRAAEHGITGNEQHYRSLGDDLYEFKAPNTARIIWFYDAGQLIICTHGFTGKRGKGKTSKGDIERAKGIRKQYLKEKENASRK